MSVFDLAQRSEAILKKYEKYDAPVKTKDQKNSDPFSEEYEDVLAEVQKLTEASEEVQLEHDRASIATKFAEIRRAKQVLITEAIEALQKKVKKGKGVNKAIIADRQEKIQQLIDKIYSIPDGTSSGIRKPTRLGVSTGTKKNPIMLDNSKPNSAFENGYYDDNQETQAFDAEWGRRRAAQDKKLDVIEEGVGRLGEMARAMQEAVDRQNPIIDDIENQMDKVTGHLKTNNVKLKGLVQKMRSSRNFCVDVILICILLAIGAYIYSMFK